MLLKETMRSGYPIVFTTPLRCIALLLLARWQWNDPSLSPTDEVTFVAASMWNDCAEVCMTHSALPRLDMQIGMNNIDQKQKDPPCRNNTKAWARVRRKKESWPVENPKRFLPVWRIPDGSAALRNTVEPSLLGRFLTSSDEINHPIYALREGRERYRERDREKGRWRVYSVRGSHHLMCLVRHAVEGKSQKAAPAGPATSAAACYLEKEYWEHQLSPSRCQWASLNVRLLLDGISQMPASYEGW